MEPAVILGLAGLALIDSTSVGTLGIPILMLVHPRVQATRVLVYLAALAGFYWFLGVVLFFAADTVADAVGDMEGNRTVDLVQFGIGIAMLAASFWPDTPMAKARAASDTNRLARWRDRLADGVGLGGIVAMALLAGLIEAASMLPYLGAVSLISSSGVAPWSAMVMFIGYVLVMSLPAVALLGARLFLGSRIQPLLERIDQWMTRHTGGALWWVVGIIGVLLALDAAARLGWMG